MKLKIVKNHSPQIRWFILLTVITVSFLSCRKEEDIILNVEFAYTILDSSYTIPAHISFNNQTTGADFYKWTFEGGDPAIYDKRNPGTITFSSAGTIKVKLEAWNDVERKEKEITIILDSVVKAGFDAIPVINDFAPVDYNFNNTSVGASMFSWQFTAANTANSTEKNPQAIRFNNPGMYRVFLESKNDRGKKDTISKIVRVRPALAASFTIDPSFEDIDDYEAPLVATLNNTTISATTHNWQAPGGQLSNSSDSIPTVTYNNPGTYTITYAASNGKQNQTVTQTIIVKPNTGMRTFSNVKFGINTADTTLGCFFSTSLRKKFKSNEVNATNGAAIDICFFGLNNSFTFNKFISPDTTQFFTFPFIPNAGNTQFVNAQETCNCGPVFTSTNFDNAISGSMLNAINVPATGGNNSFTSSMIPRIVLFKNQAGKKGAIKITQYTNNGAQSYILCDIKVQKN